MAARYRLPFLDFDRPFRLPDWLSSGVRPAQGGQVRGRGEPAHVRTGFGDGVLGGAAPPPGHGFSLLELFLIGGQQPLDRLSQPGCLSTELVDARQHDLEQRGVVGGEELRAFEGFFQLGNLPPGGGAGQLGQDPWGCVPRPSGGP
jgi:hypothetical protein